MAAEYSFLISDTLVDEPYDIDIVSTFSFTIKNTGDVTGTDLGFYLRSASSDGPFEYPSTESPALNLVDILKQGASGYGLKLFQDTNEYIFEPGVGDSYETRIPLELGSGTDLDELAPGESIEISLELSFSPLTPTRTFYVDIVIA